MEMNTDDLPWKHEAFTDKQHQSLNRQLMDLVEYYDLVSVPARQSHLARILWNVYLDAREVDPSLVVPNREEFASALETTPRLREILEEDIKLRDLKRTRSLLMFRDKQSPARSKPNPPQAAHTDADAQRTATINSWEHDAPVDFSLLKGAMTVWMGEPSQEPYARSLAMVQSSGTGKSRMNDEMAKKIVYVPMVLAEHDNVYPPRDKGLTLWILRQLPDRSQSTVAQAVHMLLRALLMTTSQYLRELASEIRLADRYSSPKDMLERLAELAAAFRSKLAEGCAWDTQGLYRIAFYKAVTDMADELIKKNPITTGTISIEKYANDLDINIRKEGEAVSRILNPFGGEVFQPLLVLCFDEADSLTNDEGGWSIYSELRRALRSIRDSPIFSIFLSTSVSIRQFSPAQADDPSLRISAGREVVFPPFTETGYDQLAIKVSTTGNWSLEHVATVEYMCHLGRPLFGSRYDFASDEVKRMMIAFAARKLICGTPEHNGELHADAKLACLSVLLGLEFQDTAWSRQAERKQVERHMRLCIDGRPETMRTVSPSEPILAEGALYIMRSGYATALDNHLRSTYLGTGERGEVIAALLVILARRAATSPPTSGLRASTSQSGTPPATGSERHPKLKDPIPDSNRRVLPLIAFLEELLHPEDFETVCNSFPSQFQQKGDSQPLRKVFAGSFVYFNHCIKARSFDVVNQKALFRIIPRGGILICANNMRGVDLIIPVTFKGTALRPDNTTAVLIQVKNDLNFTHNLRTPLFDSMNPMDIGLFTESSTPLPVIRMVFALASPQSGVTVAKRGTRSTSRKKTRSPTTFDIWCAGCCDKTFKVISKDENATYRSLLNRTFDRSSDYDVDSKNADFKKDVAKSRRSMYPGADTDAAHWSEFIEEGDEDVMDTSG